MDILGEVLSLTEIFMIIKILVRCIVYRKLKINRLHYCEGGGGVYARIHVVIVCFASL